MPPANPPPPDHPTTERRARGRAQSGACSVCGWSAQPDPDHPFSYDTCPRCHAPLLLRFGPGRYRMRRLIGDAPNATLYIANDPRLERRVTLKVENPNACNDDDAPLRIMQEARALAALDHPNIGRIFELRESPDNSFFATEPLETTLADPIASGETLSVPFVLKLLTAATAALDSAHQRGFFHHRLLPSHFLLNDESELRLLGFGAAHTAHGLTDLYPAEAAFLAPEVRDKNPLADERSDFFSLGVIGYALLTGRLPIVPRRHGRKLPLASRFRSELPDDLITLLAQLLRFNAADRPQNFNDLQRQLACLH
ncbi:MAG: serine/threonine-protein kinase [Algisphaera sp.]